MYISWNGTLTLAKNTIKLVRKILRKPSFNRLKLPQLNLSLALIVLGLVLLLITPLYKQATLIWQNQKKNVVVQLQTTQEPIKADFGIPEVNSPQDFPIKIIIPSISLNLSVLPSKVINGYWELSENTASFGLGSTPPGIVGNTVIFAHARKGLFGNLDQVKKDDQIYVLTEKGWFLYKIVDIKEVWPNQVEVIKETSSETLTLYTCSGFSDTKRLIVIGKRM